MMIGLLVTLVLFPLVGSAVASLVGRGSWFLYGVGACGAVLFLAGAAHVDLAAALAVLIVASAATLFFRRKRMMIEHVSFPRVASVIMAAPLVALLFTSAVLPFSDYDGRAFWLLKAKALATERQIDGPFFHQQTVHDPRNHYPLLMPLNAAAVMIVSRSIDDHHVRWLYVLVFAAFVLEVRRRIARLTTAAVGAWCAVLLAWTPQFVTKAEGGALSGYNDIAVAAFVAAAVFELIEATSPLRFGLWLSFLVLTKSEGVPLAFALLAAGAYVFRRQIVGTLPALTLALGVLLIWRSRIPPGDEEHFGPRLALLPERLDLLVPAVGGFSRHLVAVDDWGVLWIATLIAVAVLLWRRTYRPVAVAVYALLAITGIYIGVYMVTAWFMADLINLSASRLIMHMTGPALTIIGVGFSTTTKPLPGRPISCI